MRLPTRLLRRKADSHKGDFGHVFILAGSAGLSGAAVLCAKAALRSGAGLVTLGIPASLNGPIIKIKPPEVMTLPLPETKEISLSPAAYNKIKEFSRKTDIIAIGPGLSQNKATQELILKVIAGIDKPMVIDADGLNSLGKQRKQFRGNIILTPHPGEMSRLTGLPVPVIQKNRKKVAKEFANEYNVEIVLKGKNTLVADNKDNFYVNKTGNPGMAKAGSGDVLTGIIAAFLGQGLNLFQAAKYAVYLHGSAGDLAAKKKTQISMTASDIIDMLPEAIKKS
ncbi:MAG: NAD(P)H-hydrate dehydratase [Candidatus Omnitrophica bacterium]|nr:NAD(P)H-hydrate dehydratase [Candidatus Omnitrophota bacterium]